MSRRRRGAVGMVDEAAVLDAIRAVSRDRFGDGDWGVGWTVWDVRRPDGMPSALVTAQKFGLLVPGMPVGSREWDVVLRRAGLKPAPVHTQRDTTPWAGESTLQVRDDGDAYRLREGLLCVPRYLAVREWDPRAHCYRVVGWQLVYMAI